LTSPLALLGIYCIIPNPFYDPDTCLLLLVLFNVMVGDWRAGDVGHRRAVPNPRGRLERATTRPPGFGTARRCPTPVPADSLALGAACALPLIAKQNIGLAFLVAALLLFLLERSWRAAAGVILGAGAIAAFIAAAYGLENYLHWTIRYAAERRLPPLAQQLAIFNDPTLWWWLGVAALALFVRRARWLIAVPWLWSEWRLFVTDDPLEHEVNFLRFWPLLIVLGLLVAARRRITFPLFAIAAILGAFLSQSMWGSTYGIWPLLVLLLAIVWRELDAPLVPAVIVAAVMLHHGWLYVAQNERLTYAKIGVPATFPATTPSWPCRARTSSTSRRAAGRASRC
jgi:hypothetical protein